MTAQVLFRTDEDLKKQALKKAKQEGLTLKAILNYCMKYYVEGKLQFGIDLVEAPTALTEMSSSAFPKEIEELLGKVKGRLSPRLSAGARLLLFGSWAQGKALPQSDLDIAVQCKRALPFSKMVELRAELEKIPTLRSIDLVDLNAVDDRFKNNILKDAKVL